MLVVSSIIGWTSYLRAENAAIVAQGAERRARTQRDTAYRVLLENSNLRRQQMIEVVFSLAASNRYS